MKDVWCGNTEENLLLWMCRACDVSNPDTDCATGAAEPIAVEEDSSSAGEQL